MQPRAARPVTLLALVLALVGCGSGRPERSLSPDHPAKPAAETVYHPPRNPFGAGADARAATESTDAGRPRDASEGIVFVCPMHPDVVRSEPGACPKCHMALVPRKPAAAPRQEPR